MRENRLISFNFGNVSIRIPLKGFWFGADRPTSPMHSHGAFEHHILLKGEAKIETEGNTMDVPSKHFVLIPPDVFHSFRIGERGSVVLSFSFYLEKNRRKRAVDYDSIFQENADRIAILPVNAEQEGYVNRIAAGVYSERLSTEDRLTAWFSLLFMDLAEALAKENSSKLTDDTDDFSGELDARTFMIEEYFNEYYMDNLSLHQLAETLCLSEKQTDRLVRKAFGEGFSDHLTAVRLTIAKKLLKDSEKKVGEIASEIGYRSYNGFYFAFKKKTGKTPEEYRKGT